jgi:hypothetical protein
MSLINELSRLRAATPYYEPIREETGYATVCNQLYRR